MEVGGEWGQPEPGDKGERADGVNGLFLQLQLMYMFVTLLPACPQHGESGFEGCPGLLMSMSLGSE